MWFKRQRGAPNLLRYIINGQGLSKEVDDKQTLPIFGTIEDDCDISEGG